jgi:thioesterase domain-containing protein
MIRHTRADKTFYGLHVVGRDGEKLVYDGVEDMAARYVEVVRSVQAEGPYFLGGFCYGGMVAFEMAQQFYAQGQAVALLVLFDTFGPIQPRIMRRVFCHFDKLFRLEAKERWTYILEKGKIAAGRIKRASMLAPNFRRGAGRYSMSFPEDEDRGFVLLNPKYKVRTYPGRLTLFRAGEQQSGFNPDPFSGWKGMAAMGVEVHDVPGDHITMLKEPHVRVLTEKLNSCLDRA